LPEFALEALRRKPKEITMNDSPWHVNDMARMQRERLQEEMRQIRLEEKALSAGERRPGLLSQVGMLLSRWLKGSRKQATDAVRPPAIEPTARPGEAQI
jgi:hypothetical protein